MTAKCKWSILVRFCSVHPTATATANDYDDYDADAAAAVFDDGDNA